MPGRLSLVAALVIATAPSMFGAANAPQHLRWSELGVVIGHAVSIGTPDGVVAGKAIAVEADAFVVEVKHKPVRVPRANVRRFEMLRKGTGYRVLGTTLGILAGATGGAGAAIAVQGGIFSTNNQGQAAATFVGILAAATTGGYLLGNAADKHWTPVEVVD